MSKRKPLEMYVHYEKSKVWGHKEAHINVKDLRLLVKMAGLIIHPPDEATGVVRINRRK